MKSADLRKQMEILQAQLRKAEAAEDQKFGQLVRKAGLLDLDLSEEELLKGFKSLADNFRNGVSSTPATPQTPYYDPGS